ncbi:MAG: cysteine--tRNA ligase [Pseudomonadales bacterium]|nr:cysteine--tRNA ligase [Pseudomonadales bacterium]
MNMNLYNTMSRSVEAFEPQHPPKVSLYACGLTVYDFTHLGHLRKYTMDDVLIRALRYAGYEVEFVQNVTDVGHLASDADEGEDKLEKGAKKYGESVYDIAHKFEDYFFMSMDKMGNLRPDVSCRATEHIDEQLEMVKTLEEKGYTYVIKGDGVYFDTSKLDDYGKLARLDIEKLKEGARVEMIAGKRNPTDFALWKFEREGENRAMVWPSPWHERSFPGWHVECSAMSMKYLGNSIDIHTGGIDHIPVHHTNEIAQAEAATGEVPFVHYWVHHNFLRIEGEKMSKSLGNFYTIDDVIKRGYQPKALRLLFLGSHYRSELNFTWNTLAGTQKALDKLIGHLDAVWDAELVERTALSSEAKLFMTRFENAIADDLNTATAVAVLWEMVKFGLSAAEMKTVLQEMDKILGFDFSALVEEYRNKPRDIPDGVSALMTQREVARNNKDWQESDRLRDEIAQKGYSVEDTADGQVVKKV